MPVHWACELLEIPEITDNWNKGRHLMPSRIQPGRRGFMLAALFSTGMLISPASMADETTCPLPGQTRALMVQMFFGLSIAHRGPVTTSEWNGFLRQTVTPRFPDGFTVYDAYGQWQDRDSKRITRERSRVIEVALEDTQAAHEGIAAIAETYRKRFRQQSVGIVSHMACVAFN